MLRRFTLTGFGSVRAKFVSAYAAGIVLPVIACLALLYWLGLAPAVSRLEQSEARRRLDSCERLIVDATKALQTHAWDYGVWDEMYQAVDSRDPEWLKINLTDWAVEVFHLDGILLFDKKGEIVYEWGKLRERVTSEERRRLFKLGMEQRAAGGLLGSGEEILAVGLSPVLRSDRTGPVNGVYLVAQWATDSFAREVADVLRDGVWLYRNGQAAAKHDPFSLPVPPQPGEAIQASLARGEVPSERLTDRFLVAYAPLRDLFGERIGTLGVVRNRTVAHEARNSAAGAAAVLGLVGLLLALVHGRLMARWVVKPVEELAVQVKSFEEGQLGAPIEAAGSGEIAELAQAFEKMRGSVQRLLEDLRQANARLQELATTDTLTGLRTRHFLNEWLEAEVVRCERFGYDMGCVMLDLDDFKEINDSYGHAVGDAVLAGVARVLLGSLRAFDVAVRYGGEEYLVLLPQTGLEQTAEVAERIREAVEGQRYGAGEVRVGVTLSVGVANLQRVSLGPARGRLLVERADRALYQAKRMGKNRVVVYDESLPPALGGTHTTRL